jgi:hypothetical protein
MTDPRTPQEDLELIQSFASRRPRDDEEARAREWFGWRPVDRVRCPRALAGKRCRQYSQGDNTCICVRLYHPLLDHPRRWIDAHGEPILTAESYEFDGEDFADLVRECAELGLRVHVRGCSPYFPGRAILIIIRRER